ncbi:Nonribosomal peptide synthetase 14 [Madurella mycetomatis]|uniref:Nonribosomal peptide synthetase 14 n=1 Tax=Madurella mycetomatis TaxID=100816 RepID=A0A175W020_9PEZI|nr:Nonribosomal peptide synthetase 14 [Madurella mycetomatis]
MSSSYKRPIDEPIAVVGSGCRFAGDVNNASGLWRLLAHPTDLSREIPKSRFNIDAFFHPDGEYHGTTNSPKAYFLDQDHRVFDAGFFNITPKEAEAIDPQQRMLLEVVYEALEDAGYTLRQYAGEKVAVFAGVMTADYDTLSQRDELDTSRYYATGNARSILSNRISYFFNFTGPSLTIDTACSSSLVALHQAVLSLRSGECEMACVAGANLIITPEQFVVESSLHMLSPSGHCRMWDAKADGYARGEGVAAIFIKPLSKAIRDGDRIDAIIRQTGVNSDGRSRGITMPNWKAQSQLIQDTYTRAGLNSENPEDRCQYFEAHGTGTSAGDPNEARAIENAFFHNGKAVGPGQQVDPAVTAEPATKLLVGSVKTIIGHTEGAAGLAGLLKVVQSMHNNLVPPNLHLTELNPDVQQYCSNLLVPTSALPWPDPPAGHPKRASVNSFGFGGTNAHVIVEQYLPNVHDDIASFWNPKPARLLSPGALIRNESIQHAEVCLPLVLSAASQKSLVTVVRNYRDYLQNSALPVSELAWYLLTRRTAFPFRVSVAGLSAPDLVRKLDSVISKTKGSSAITIGTRARQDNESPKILGIFTGQGAQWVTMSRGLFKTSEIFSCTIRELDKILQACSDPPSWTLEEQIVGDGDSSMVNKASVSQPLCTAVQLALVEVIWALGVSFHTVVGHSSGEIAAAYAAGKIRLRDAILISYYRGLRMHLACGANGAKGGMLAVGLNKAEAEELCARDEYRHGLTIAANNGPSSITLSGDLDLVEHARDSLVKEQKFARQLVVDTAYHSHHMERPSAEYLEALYGCNIEPDDGRKRANWVSSVYGSGAPPDGELTAIYWKDNMTKPVLFYEAVSSALETFGPFDCAIEVGPHPALKGPVTQTIKEKNGSAVPYSGLLSRGLDDRVAFANFLGWMWSHFSLQNWDLGMFVGTSSQLQLSDSRVTGVPSYPWDHSQVHYRESRISRQYHLKTEKPHELLGVRTRDDNKYLLRWRNILKLEKLPWARHHSFQGQALLPASAYLVMSLDAARFALAGRPASTVELRDLTFPSGIILEPNSPGIEVLFTLTVEKELQGSIEASFTLASTVADGRTDMKKNFTGKLVITLGQPSAGTLPPRRKERAETLHASPQGFYEMMEGTGLVYTLPFKGLETLERRYNFSSGTVRKFHPEDSTKLSISPATLDSCLQTAFVTVSSPGDGALWTSFLPVHMDSVRFNLAICDIKAQSDTLAVDAYMTKATPITGKAPASFTADIEIFNANGDMEIQVQGLTVGSFSSTKPEDDYDLYLTTKWDVDPDYEIIEAESQDNHGTLMLNESCDRVASFYLRNRQVNFWPNETEETLDDFIRASPYFSVLDFIRRLGDNVPDLLEAMLPVALAEARGLASFQKHIARVVRQIAHKYPRMSVLGLTDPELGLSEHVIASLGDSFLSYRLGAEPEKNIENRIPLSDSLLKKIKVDKVDLDKSAEYAIPYDLVLLSTSLIEPGKAGTVLKTIKSMMRPGGFLILINMSSTLLKGRIRRLAGLGTRDAVIVSPAEWPALLVQAGLGTSMASSHQTYPPSFSMIVRQADCHEKRSVLHPSTHICASEPTIIRYSMDLSGSNSKLADHVLLIGDSAIQVALCQHLEDVCGKVTTIPTLDNLDIPTVSLFSAAVILCDLDKPVLANMTEKQMDALRALFRPEMTMLWVTQNARFHNPDQAASFGFARTLVAETPGLRLQVVDIDLPDSTALDTIALTFVQLTRQKSVSDTKGQKSLWISEPEIHLENGHRLVPRVLPWKEGNDRVNAPRRVVSNVVNTLDNIVRVVSVVSEEGSTRYEVVIEEPHTGLQRVNYSTVEPLDITGMAYSVHVCVGQNPETQGNQVTLARSNASFAIPHSICSANIDNGSGQLDQPVFIALLTRYLSALGIAKAARDKSVLLIEPDPMFNHCLGHVLTKSGIQFRVCTTDENRCSITPGMTYLHPNCPAREVKALLPPEGAVVIDMLPKTSKVSEVLFRSLPGNCLYNPRTTLVDAELPLPREDLGALKHFWKEAVEFARLTTLRRQFRSCPNMMSVPDLLQSAGPVGPFQILDWKAERDVPRIVKPLVETRMLSPHKTYVFVGLTRDFGQSLCTLFVQQGARNIVLSSRNPPAKQTQWQTELLRKGINVRFEALDVTSLEQVTAFKSKLALDMPPVGGVVNGAMVLDDRVFSQMTVETLHRVMNPKTTGSKNLDLVFDSSDMDFFIMTSSFAAIGGHAGQSNYAAANMYMNGLAASRRRRGLPGSVLNIGVIYGLGFLHREKDSLYEGLEREGYPPISERDIHHMFAEAITAGRPVPGQIYDITTGLRRFVASNPTLAWHHDPRFSHFVQQEDDSETAGDSPGVSGSEKQNLKELVGNAQTVDELVDVLVGGFIARLRNQLHLSEGAVTGDHSVIELGVDSLAAVEIRSWVWKTLGQDVAVMKILGGSTIEKLCRDMAEGIIKGRKTEEN